VGVEELSAIVCVSSFGNSADCTGVSSLERFRDVVYVGEGSKDILELSPSQLRTTTNNT